jgi:hypothetical protein
LDYFSAKKNFSPNGAFKSLIDTLILMKTVAQALNEWHESYKKANITIDTVAALREPINHILTSSRNPDAKCLASTLYALNFYLAHSTHEADPVLPLILTHSGIISEVYRSAGTTYETLLRHLQREPDIGMAKIELDKV